MVCSVPTQLSSAVAAGATARLPARITPATVTLSSFIRLPFPPDFVSRHGAKCLLCCQIRRAGSLWYESPQTATREGWDPMATPATHGRGLDGYFRITERGSSVRTEVVAGLTTFMTMAYILFLN